MTPNKSKEQVPGSIRLPVYLYLTWPLAVLAAPLEMALPGRAGQLAFVLMLVLTLMAAFEGGFRSGLLTGLAGSLGLTGLAWFAEWFNTGALQTVFLSSLPITQAIVLAGCGACCGWYLDIRRGLEHLEERCQYYEQCNEQLQQKANDSAEVAQLEQARREAAEAQRIELSRLFLNLQHLGRELSGNLEIRAVSRLVTEAAKKLLNAPHPRLFLLDEQSTELVEHTPGSSGARYPADRGMLGWVVGHGQIITAEDMTNIHSLASMHDQDPAEWQACAPLAVGQRVLGVLAIDSIEQQAPEFERLLYILANFSAVALNNGQLFQRVERMARHDGLTGLLNHAAFQSRLADMLHDARGTGQPLSVIMADLDHFKHFNDRFGHQAGDYVLSSAGKLWSGLIAQQAAAARYGGEEFVCLLPGATLDEAAVQAEALRWALEQADLQFDGVPLHVTASFGVATFPTSADAPATLIRGADSALYAAKRSGRNRVCVAQDCNRDEPLLRETASAARC